jgi:hypothetical protein
MNKMPLWLLCCVMLLTACTGTPQTQIKVIKPDIPDSLRTCDDVPNYPGDGMTQRDVAKWSARLWYAHADCRSKLQSLSNAVGVNNEQYESKR